MPHTLTTISIQGDEQPAFEIYADEDREQTLGFAYDETNAHLWTAASDLLEALKDTLDALQSVDHAGRYKITVLKGLQLLAKTA